MGVTNICEGAVNKLLTFSNRLRSAADLQRTVELAPMKNVTARRRLTKKAKKKYRPATLQGKNKVNSIPY